MTCTLCRAPEKAIGLCHMHLMRYYRTGDPLDRPDNVCHWCGESFRSRTKRRRYCSRECQGFGVWAKRVARAA